MTGYLSEVFASFEGEGDRVGMPAVFVRMAGCNLACSFCDTAYARERTDSATLFLGRRESRLGNPVSPGRLSEIIGSEFPGYSDVRMTGGEPLLQADFVEEAADILRRMGRGLHLETNGTLAAEMARVRHLFQTVTMDIKLPSTQDGAALYGEHSEFLESLRSGTAVGAVETPAPRVCVKIVVTPECRDDEVIEAFDLVGRIDPNVTVFIQPEFDKGAPLVSGERIMSLLMTGLGTLTDVRVSFQMHKILKMR